MSACLSFRTCLRRNLLAILQVAGVLAGVALGFALKAAKKDWKQRDISYVQFGGELFLNMLKGLILPLIMSSMISAVGSLDLSLSKMIGARGVAYYMTTTVIAIILGIVLSVTIQPGRFSDDHLDNNDTKTKTEATIVEDNLMDLVRTMFPPNVVQAALQRYRTKLTYPVASSDKHCPDNSTNPNANKCPFREYTMSGKWENGTNMMGLVVFSIALGIALASIGPRGKPVLDLFKSMADAMTVLTTWVIWISPIGVAFLVASEIVRTKNFASIIKSLGLYFSTVTIGLFIHGFITIPLIYFLLTRRPPFKFIGNMMPVIAMAFGSGSSIATLPINIKCLEENNKVDPRVARFLLPIGATINMDGTALYEAVAAIFIAQLVKTDLPLGKIIAIAVTATAASIGAAGIPQAGLVTMVMVLNTVGLNENYIAYIVPIDWLLDRFRTVINVMGDGFGCGIIDKMCKKQLEMLPIENENFLPVESATSVNLKLNPSSGQISSDDAENKGSVDESKPE